MCTLDKNFIFNFRIYKISFYASLALQTLAPLNLCFLLHFSRILFSTFLTFSMFRSPVVSLNRLIAFSHCQKFALINNSQNLTSGFIYRDKHCTTASLIKVILLKVGVCLILQIHYTLFTGPT